MMAMITILYSDSRNFPGSNPTLLPRFQRHLAEQKSWQAPKDAKNPLTPATILDMACNTRMTHHDSDSVAIYDWLFLGLSTGARRVEYAQTSRTKIEMAWVQPNQQKPPLEQPNAFVDGDFKFLDKNSKPLQGRARDRAAFVRVCWRTQKNKNNGETKLFAIANDDRLCLVGAAWRIQAHFERLHSNCQCWEFRLRVALQHQLSPRHHERVLLGYKKSTCPTTC